MRLLTLFFLSLLSSCGQQSNVYFDISFPSGGRYELNGETFYFSVDGGFAESCHPRVDVFPVYGGRETILLDPASAPPFDFSFQPYVPGSYVIEGYCELGSITGSFPVGRGSPKLWYSAQEVAVTAISTDLGSGTAVSDTASIGVVPHTNWIQQNGFPTFTATNLEDDSGSATTADLEFSASGSGNVTSLASGSGDLFDMFTRGVRVPQTSSASLIYSEIPYSSYDVYVYIAETATDTADLYEFSDGTTTYYYESQGADNFNSGTLSRISSTNSGTPSTSGNYVLFEGLSSSSITITATSTDNNEMALVGIQVVEAASGVVITDVNTTESWVDGDSGLLITGSGFI